jgi:hypothetical protein
MSWIKDNPFVVALGGITALATGALVFFGSHSSGQYQEHLDQYTADASKVVEAEKLSIYPNPANSRGKSKALTEYRSDLTKLQSTFAPYRPDALKKLDGQEFTGNLKAADAKVRDAFMASKTTLPDAFFLGFETYKSGALAKMEATGILDFQLGAATELFLDLAKAAPTKLINVYRSALPEESGGTYEAKDSVYRPLPMEVTFVGTERSLREFVTALESSDSYFYSIRALRCMNSNPKGPGPADAKFESVKPAGGAADPFGSGAVVLPGETAPAAAPAGGKAKPAAADGSRILQQVLGSEEISVFIRLDVLQFLPTNELPKP